MTYSSVFRDLLLQWPPGSNTTTDNEKRNETDHFIHLDGVTAFEFESLLNFFYEGYGNVLAPTRFCALLFKFLTIFLPAG